MSISFDHDAPDTTQKTLRSCFITINNHTDDDINNCKNWSACSWIAVGYHVGEEKHVPHIHIAAQFKKSTLFSTIKNRFPKNGHIQTLFAREKASIVDYLQKYEGKLVHEAGEFKEKIPGMRNDLIAWKEDIDAGMCPDDLKRKHYPVYMKYNRCADEMERFLRPKKVKPLKTNWAIPLFTDFTKALVLIGPEGIGKTQFAKACLPGAPVISHIDGLKVIRDFSKGIIFDDMDFTKKPYDWARGAQIHLLDWEEDREIHSRYQNIYIPAETKKIFCCNERPFIVDGAIDRRINVVRLHEKLFRAEEEPPRCVAEGNEPSVAQPRKRARVGGQA